MTAGLPPRPTDATLSVTKAARILGVHPNTIRAWSDQGRLRYYRINPRGDRRYRVGDLQGFLAAAEATGATTYAAAAPAGRRRARPAGRPWPSSGARTGGRRSALPGRRRGDRMPRRLASPRSARRTSPPSGPATGSTCGSWPSSPPSPPVAATSTGCSGRPSPSSASRSRYDLVAAYRAARRDARRPGRARQRPDPADRPARWPTAPSGRAIREDRPILSPRRRPTAGSRSTRGRRSRSRCRSPSRREHWGVLVVGSADPAGPDRARHPVPRQRRPPVRGRRSTRPGLFEEAAQQVHRLDALRRVASDIGSKLDLDQTLAGLVDHATVLFQADRAAVFLRGAGRPGRARRSAAACRRRTSPPSATSRCRRCPGSRSPPAGRCSRPTTRTTRAARRSGRRSSRRASTPCARRRSSTARSCSGC